MLPMQGAPSYDDLELDREVPLEKNGPDPEKEDRVMLTRHRVSRILFDDKFYDYPVSLKLETLKNMGIFYHDEGRIQLSGIPASQDTGRQPGKFLY